MKPKTEIAIVQVAIDDLHPDPANPRRISDADLEALTRSIQEFGMVDPIIARREDSTVIGGHQRLVAARRLGLKTVPVVFVDVSAEQAHLLNLALNRISGSWDQELLARLLADLEATPNIDLSLTGFGDDEIAKLLKSLDARERRGREESFDLDAAWQAAQADSRVVRGDVWLLGDHRVMCGDSTSEADVARLMAGESARLMVADPPYRVAYEVDGKNPKFKKRRSAIANDDLGGGQAKFWTDAFRHWPLEGDAYVFSPSGPLISTLCASIEAAGIEHHQWLIWVKDRLVLGRSHYHYRHEHVFYGWKGKSSWNGSRKEDSVWDEPRPADSPEHPTIKPLPLCERAIENSSQPNDVVIDAFLGSGTTLIAAERTGRRCFGMEIDPPLRRLSVGPLGGVHLAAGGESRMSDLTSFADRVSSAVTKDSQFGKEHGMTDEMSKALMAARDAAEDWVKADDPDVSAAAEKLLDCTAPDDDGQINEHDHLIAALQLIAALGVGHGDDLPAGEPG